jgi:subtilase family serine protease
LIPVAAQKATLPDERTLVPVVPSLVVERVDDRRLVKLSGNTHPMARPEFNKGLLEPSKPMERMLLVLKRSPEQEQALAAFNERQYDPNSPDYHHWLHAEEFGQLYGLSDSDMAAVTSWLQNHGFQIYTVSKGRVTIEFSGTVEQVQSTFQVEMHKYLVNGEEHIANDRDPSIPAALAPVVAGVASLHDFFHKPQSVFGNYVKKDLRTGKMTNLGRAHIADSASRTENTPTSNLSVRARNSVEPQLTYTPSGETYPHEDMTPYDFATIYNILPSWNSKILGTNTKIAISGVSDIAASDVTAFRKTFGLSGFAGTFTTKVNGTDPGADGGGGQGENTLDVEMAGATAPNAQVILVVSANTATTGGDELSDSYIIDNEVAPIMSASYGECELNLGKTGNAAINAIWQQGATSGISIFESSGDQGSAGCSNSDEAGPTADQTGLQVNGIASSPYLTAVGGTDFTWSFVQGGPAKYWATSNGAQLQNALGYMPEVPWNGTCTNPLIYPLFTDGFNSPEQLCNAVLGGSYDGLVKITGGSGGVSHCTTGGTTNATCSGGYSKPSWQTGLGVPNDSHRDLPDVSLFASAGFPDGIVGSAILD